MGKYNKKTIGVLFGGRSVEHEVSVITGIQAANALDADTYTALPIYVSKDGDWFSGPSLLDLELYKNLEAVKDSATPVRPVSNSLGGLDLMPTKRRLFGRGAEATVDTLLLAMHGAEGENGALQGALEILGARYTGSDVTASAIGMDKALSKLVAKRAGVPVLEDLVINDDNWTGSEDAWLARCESELGLPVMVKPMRLGSSIGIGRAQTRDELEATLEDVFRLDNRALIEPCIDNLRELNCSVLSRADGPAASVIEEPVKQSGTHLLSFEQKYQRGIGAKGSPKSGGREAGMASLDRIIPAKVPDDKADYLKELATRTFTAIGCSGVARIDFLYDVGRKAFFFNEINTIPGSFSFYLWEPSGVSFEHLLHELIEGAHREYQSRNAKVRSYETNLLSENALRGIKK